MEKIIVYVDDAAFAREQLGRLLGATETASRGARHWILVACAPRMTQRISKWVSHSARENWRGRWFNKVQDELVPLLKRDGDALSSVLAKGPLTDLTRQLRMAHGVARVIDARRPKIGVDMEPVAPEVAPPASDSGWALPSAAAGLGALRISVNEFK